jgi:subtilisin family serine protease
LHAVQTPTPSWGLDRIDQRNLPLNQAYEYLNDGSGVHAYVIDSGIRATHNEFSGRVGNGFDFIDNDTIPNDCNGHGTHVAGTLGGTNFGVAKNVTIHPVRVFGCGNTTPTSTIIAGINWVSANRQLPAVANMSLGGPALTALDTAVVNLINSGVVAVVSAGNDNGANACNSSPARVANALTVASSTMTDQRSGFSNIGNCIDIFAPGSAIVSAWITSNTASNTLNGTSMAAPHVSGVAALRLDVQPSQTPAQVNTAIINSATTNRISNPGSGTPNRLLFSGSGSSSSSSSSSSSGGSCPASGTFVTSACSSGVVGAAQTAASTCCNGYYSVPQGGYSCYAFYCN